VDASPSSADLGGATSVSRPPFHLNANDQRANRIKIERKEGI